MNKLITMVTFVIATSAFASEPSSDCTLNIIKSVEQTMWSIPVQDEDLKEISSIMTQKGYQVVPSGTLAASTLEVDKSKVTFSDGESAKIVMDVYLHPTDDITGAKPSGKSSINLFRSEKRATITAIRNALEFLAGCN